MNRQADADQKSDLGCEEGDDFLRGVTELRQAWNDRFTPTEPRYIQRYLRGELNIHGRLLLKPPGSSNPHYLSVTFIGPQQLPKWRFGDDFDIVRLQTFIRVKNHRLREGYSAGDDQQQFVFVGDIEAMKNGERFLSRRAAACLVRLDSFEFSNRPFGQSLYYRPLECRFELLDAPANREVNIPSISGSIGNECPHQMVETGPKLVSNLPNNHSKSQRDDGENWRFENVIKSIVAFLDTNYVDIRCAEAGNFSVEISDVLVGPLNLFPATVKWM